MAARVPGRIGVSHALAAVLGTDAILYGGVDERATNERFPVGNSARSVRAERRFS